MVRSGHKYLILYLHGSNLKKYTLNFLIFVPKLSLNWQEGHLTNLQTNYVEGIQSHVIFYEKLTLKFCFVV